MAEPILTLYKYIIHYSINNEKIRENKSTVLRYIVPFAETFLVGGRLLILVCRTTSVLCYNDKEVAHKT